MGTIYPVILSGGSGTRLWPLSRAMYPKQFIRFFGDEADSLLEATLRRLPAGPSIAKPLIVTNNDHRFLVQEMVARVGVKPGAIILEPEARNTAPALAVAALHVAAHDPDGVLVVAPSDHAIADPAKFLAAVVEAAAIAAKGRLVLFGIKPTSPHTGYGYIKRGADLDGSDGRAYLVDAFVEKPDAQTAAGYLASGAYFWNSGIFVLHAATFLAEMERLCPDILSAAREALAGAVEDLGFLRLDAAGFAKSPSISID
jgi:mannose-1-phosphate guanylyltransferase/mannose-6-phosphate isomerase